jgi:hypothetical protein
VAMREAWRKGANHAHLGYNPSSRGQTRQGRRRTVTRLRLYLRRVRALAKLRHAAEQELPVMLEQLAREDRDAYRFARRVSYDPALY